MTATEAQVAAAMEALGCKPYDGPWNAMNEPVCDRHGDWIWTDRGCPVAVRAADAVVAAGPDQATIAADATEEWRVTGDVGGTFGPYEFTHRGDDAEERAHAFIGSIAGDSWDDGPHLHHRVVSHTPWIEFQP